MKKRLTAVEVEALGNEMRKEAGITREVEVAVVQSIMNSVRLNKTGDKAFMILDPLYVHVPDWQRVLDTQAAINISTDYVEELWDIPKVYWNNRTKRLEVADGSHRIFGTQLGKFKKVLVYLMEVDELRAIELFLDQTKRRRMLPTDYYIPGLKLNDPKYVNLKEICHKRNIKVTPDDNELKNSIGTIHGFSLCSKMAGNNPKLLEDILDTIIKMHWTGSTKEAFMSVNIRAIKKLLGENANNIKQIQDALIANCSGAKYYSDNISVLKTEVQVYDLLVTEISKHSDVQIYKAAA